MPKHLGVSINGSRKNVINCSICLLSPDCHQISMGQGQEVHARRILSQGTQNGGWLLLQNCHLSLDYINEMMDSIVETDTIHNEFRIWVTTEVHPKFPISFLQVRHAQLGIKCRRRHLHPNNMQEHPRQLRHSSHAVMNK